MPTLKCWKGEKSENTGKDTLFMFMTVFKHGGQWDMLGQSFKIKGPTFEKLF